MTKDLTEQWKNGGLKKDKKYYTKDKLGRTYIKTYNKKGFKGLVEEVLCEVPSYDEWKKMKEQRDACAWALDKIGDVLVKHKLVKKIDEVLR